MRTPSSRALRLAAFAAIAVLGALTAQAQSVPLPATEQQRSLFQVIGGADDIVVDPLNPLVIYWTARDLGVLKSMDGGTTWAPAIDGLADLTATALAMDPTDPSHVMVGFESHYGSQGSRPYRTHDSGGRWEPTLVCEREDGQNNVRQQCTAMKMTFDPTDPQRFYYLVASQFVACGGFYRSCDQGVTYDRNPRCIPTPEPRPVCALGSPEPVNSFGILVTVERRQTAAHWSRWCRRSERSALRRDSRSGRS